MLAKFLIFDNDISSLKEKKNECGKKVYQSFYYILFFIVLLFYYFVNLKKNLFLYSIYTCPYQKQWFLCNFVIIKKLIVIYFFDMIITDIIYFLKRMKNVC